MDTSWKRNAAAYNNILIYTPIDQNNKLREEEKKNRRRVLGGDRETRNSINNFFWHLFCLVASTDRASESKNSFWHLYFSPCSSASAQLLADPVIKSSDSYHTPHINLKIFLPNLTMNWLSWWSWLKRWIGIGGSVVVSQVSEIGWIVTAAWLTHVDIFDRN